MIKWREMNAEYQNVALFGVRGYLRMVKEEDDGGIGSTGHDRMEKRRKG